MSDANTKIDAITRAFQALASELRLSGELKMADLAKHVAENLPESSKLKLHEILNEKKADAVVGDDRTKGRMLIYDDLNLLKGIRYSRAHLWKLERKGKFPRRVAIGENAIAWDEDEIDAYLEAKKAARPALPPPPRPFRRVKQRGIK